MIALHWLAGALILELIAHGWIMVHGRLSAATTFDLFQSHKSLGLVVLMLTAARLFARLARASPAPRRGPAMGTAARRARSGRWRMPPLDQLPPAKLSLAAKTWMGVLRLYLVIAMSFTISRAILVR